MRPESIPIAQRLSPSRVRSTKGAISPQGSGGGGADGTFLGMKLADPLNVSQRHLPICRRHQALGGAVAEFDWIAAELVIATEHRRVVVVLVVVNADSETAFDHGHAAEQRHGNERAAGMRTAPRVSGDGMGHRGPMQIESRRSMACLAAAIAGRWGFKMP